MDFLRTNRSITCFNGNICDSGSGPAPRFTSQSSGGGGGIRTTPVSNTRPASYMRKKKFSQENAECLNMIRIENHPAIFNYLEFGTATGEQTLQLGNSVLTYPQNRLDFIEEMLERICNGGEILTSKL